VDLGVAFVADAQPPEVVQVREPALDDPAVATEAGAVRDATAGDDRFDAASPEQPPVLVVVIAAIGKNGLRLLAWPTDLALDRPGVQILEQRDQLGDVVSVAARQRNGQRDAGGVDE